MAYFVEIQKFRNKYIRNVIGIIAIFPIVQIFGIIFVNHNISMFQYLFLSVIFMMGMFFYLSFFELKTAIKKEGIYVKFIPMHVRNFFFSWEDIENLEIVPYRPFRDYFGWGYRPSIFGKGKAMTIAGYYGLKITFKNGETLLVGTQRPEELKYLITVVRDTQLLKSKHTVIND